MIAEIIRDEDSKAASLRIQTDQSWELLAGDGHRPVIQGRGSGTFPVPGSESGHQVFKLVRPGHGMHLAERRLPMKGGYNYRDIGGLPTSSAKLATAWGRIFRADDMRQLTGGDLKYLATIPLKTVVDFRSEKEIAAHPDLLPKGAGYRPLPIVPGQLNETMIRLREEDADKFMEEAYRQFVTDPHIVARFRAFFGLLQDPEAAPLLYHCSAGKDRTGFATALLLSALEVSREEIMQDYLSSSIYLAGKYPSQTGIFSVKPAFLEASFDQMEVSFGSVENFLKDGLDVDLMLLRTLYLQPNT